MPPRPFDHVGLKFVSVALAMLLWLTVAGEQVVERGLRIPIEMTNLPAGLEIVDEPPQFVDVRVRGASGAVARLGSEDLIAAIDLKSARAGRRLFNLMPEEVRAPFGVDVTQVTPPTVALTFEPSRTRELPVRPTIDGEPAPGYVVGDVTSEPKVVQVIGPASALERATAAITEPVIIEGATGDRVETVTIGVPDPTIRLKTTLSARVTVRVAPSPVERVIPLTPVHMRNVGAGLSARADPPVVDVHVRGPRAALDGLRADSANAFVDLAGLGPGRYVLPVNIDPTREFGVTAIEPAVVQITIK